MVLGEATVVGLVASGAGCGLGLVFAPVLAGALVRYELAPPGFTARASWLMLLTSLRGGDGRITGRRGRGCPAGDGSTIPARTNEPPRRASAPSSSKADW